MQKCCDRFDVKSVVFECKQSTINCYHGARPLSSRRHDALSLRFLAVSYRKIGEDAIFVFIEFHIFIITYANMPKIHSGAIITEDAYSSGHLVLSHLGLAFVLMLSPFFLELVMSTDLLRFEHPSVLLFCTSYIHSKFTFPCILYTVFL